MFFIKVFMFPQQSRPSVPKVEERESPQDRFQKILRDHPEIPGSVGTGSFYAFDEHDYVVAEFREGELDKASVRREEYPRGKDIQYPRKERIGNLAIGPQFRGCMAISSAVLFNMGQVFDVIKGEKIRTDYPFFM